MTDSNFNVFSDEILGIGSQFGKKQKFALHTVEKSKITPTKVFFRQINSLVIYLDSKCVTFTNFLPKKRESRFSHSALTWKKIVKSLYTFFFSEKVDFTEFFPKSKIL